MILLLFLVFIFGNLTLTWLFTYVICSLDGNKQKGRDILKNNILSKYNIPLIRLTINGSREESIIRSKLDEIVSNK